jgi:hypothetical protein
VSEMVEELEATLGGEAGNIMTVEKMISGYTALTEESLRCWELSLGLSLSIIQTCCSLVS